MKDKPEFAGSFKYAGEESGFYRVYYKRGRLLYCIQNDGSWGRDQFAFYRCSLDGEPEYECRFPETPEFDRLVYPDSLVKRSS